MTNKLKDYQYFVMTCPLYDDVVYGLAGELGEVVELVKKDKRKGDKRKPVNKDDLRKEAGDVLWYLTRLMGDYGISLDSVVDTNIEKLTKRHEIKK